MQHEKYLLVSFRTSKWSARKFDAKATEEVATNHNATGDIGRFNKLLLNKSDINPVNAAFAAARRQHDGLTLPWDDDGDRLLPSARLMDYRAKMQPHLAEVDLRVAHLLSRYQDLIDARRVELNGLFDPADYPSEQQMREKFAHKIEIKPVPASEAIRFGDPNIERDLREQYEEMLKERVEDAQKEVWYRLIDPIKRMVDVLSRDGRVYESTHKAILDIARLVPQYNINGDPKLDKAASDIYALMSKVNVDILRDSEAIRTITAEAAGDILSRMDSKYAGAF
jgi:hypothetical protein